MASSELLRGFAAIEARYPAWHCWEGVIAGLLYARRPLSSPPLVVRDVTLAGLEKQIAEWETSRR